MSAHHEAVHRAFASLVADSKANGERPPTIAAVADRAGISRSSMYRFHPGIVAQIRALNGHRDAERQDQLRVKMQLLVSQLRSERQFSRTLARVCAELAAEKAILQEQFEDERLSLQLKVDRLEKELQGRKNVTILRP